ncbi:GtrA family protein [Limnohabitans sp.]|uniref:GtrA family protein n=1 Tax=Limnohabitans sp. TaxID=1907725 RepID=UPI00286F88FF|nr:GtrA family protein [Limnohabitans sp.]
MRTGFWFLGVGTAAAAVHMAVFMWATPYLWPEAANAAGFCVAFGVSFAGHRCLSFSDADTGLWQSLRRFAATALAGFAANEVMFVALLRGLNLPDWLALFFALVFASAQTFLLSRFWAFRRAR